MANIDKNGYIKTEDASGNIVTLYPYTKAGNVDGLDVFGASGSGHSSGLVPDPGATSGSSKFLCENGTWAEPSGGGGGAVSGVKGNAESTYRTGNVNLTCDNIGASPNDHSHGSLGRDGAISNNVTIGSSDRLIISDYSDSGKIKTSSITFDGSTTSQALTKKGTWGTFLTSHQSLSGYVPTSRTVNGYSLSSNVSLDYEDVGLKVSTQTLTLSSMSFTKSYGGMYYSSSISPDTSYSQIFSITINGFNNVPNMAFMPFVSSTNKIGLMVCAPAAPSSLSFSAGTIGITIVGI